MLRGDLMNCPFCSKNSLQVLESRAVNQSKIRRRRRCTKCSGRFTTYETMESTPTKIIKKDGTIQNFDRNKILNGIIKSCEKRHISLDIINKLVEEIETSIRKKGKQDIRSSIIGTLVMNKLKKTDKIAYIRFASIYKDFQNIDSFKEEVNKIRK